MGILVKKAPVIIPGARSQSELFWADPFQSATGQSLELFFLVSPVLIVLFGFLFELFPFFFFRVIPIVIVFRFSDGVIGQAAFIRVDFDKGGAAIAFVKKSAVVIMAADFWH
jgi:hypothetical protein